MKRRLVVSVLLAVMLLVAMAVPLVVSADTTQYWYFTDNSYGQTSPNGTSVSDLDMSKTDPNETDHTVGITSADVAWWYAENKATVAGAFGDYPWSVHLTYTCSGAVPSANNVTADICLVTDDGTIVKRLATGTGSATNTAVTTFLMFTAADDGGTTQSWSVNDRLAVRISYSDSGTFTVHCNTHATHSFIDSPGTDPGYPIPELPTIILLTTGLVGLAAYFGLKRRKRVIVKA